MVASQLSLQTSSAPSQYITVPDSQGIQCNIPVNSLQLQQVNAIISTNQPATIPVGLPQNPSFGSLASGASVHSGLSAQSSQGSGLNVAALG